MMPLRISHQIGLGISTTRGVGEEFLQIGAQGRGRWGLGVPRSHQDDGGAGGVPCRYAGSGRKRGMGESL